MAHFHSWWWLGYGTSLSTFRSWFVWWRAICTLCKIVFRAEWCSLRGCRLEVVMQYLTMVHWCIWLLYFIRKVTYLLCQEDSDNFGGVWLLSYYVSHFSSPHLLVSNHNLFDWLHQTADNRMLLVWWEGKEKMWRKLRNTAAVEMTVMWWLKWN